MQANRTNKLRRIHTDVFLVFFVRQQTCDHQSFLQEIGSEGQARLWFTICFLVSKENLFFLRMGGLRVKDSSLMAADKIEGLSLFSLPVSNRAVHTPLDSVVCVLVDVVCSLAIMHPR